MRTKGVDKATQAQVLVSIGLGRRKPVQHPTRRRYSAGVLTIKVSSLGADALFDQCCGADAGTHYGSYCPTIIALTTGHLAADIATADEEAVHAVFSGSRSKSRC